MPVGMQRDVGPVVVVEGLRRGRKFIVVVPAGRSPGVPQQADQGTAVLAHAALATLRGHVPVVLLIVVLVGFIVIMRVKIKKHVAQPVIAQENLAPPVEPTTISPITAEPPTPMEDTLVNEKPSPEALHTDEPESDPVPAETTTVEEATKTPLSEEVELTPEVDDPNQNNPSI